METIDIFKVEFIFKEELYETYGQIRKPIDVNKPILLKINYFGDNFPCILLEFSQINNEVKVRHIRAQDWGGYSNDERNLCVRKISGKNKEFLPEKGTLDLLVLLALSIIQKMKEKNIIQKDSIVKINDLAYKDEMPISWFKFFRNYDSNILPETTYSKFGFILRNPDDKDESFETYMNYTIPYILNKKLKEYKFNKKFFEELRIFNDILKEKRMKMIKYNPNEKLEDFIVKIFETKKMKYYSELINIINKTTKFDIRGDWYWSESYYNSKVKDKIKVVKFIEL